VSRERTLRVPTMRDLSALAQVTDSDLMDSACYSMAEIKVRVAEYHLKHNKPAPTSSHNKASRIMIKRLEYQQKCEQSPEGFPAGYEATKPCSKGGECVVRVCSMDETCLFRCGHVFHADSKKYRRCARCCVLGAVPGCCVLCAGCCVLGAGCRVLGAVCCVTLGAGCCDC
jgi:hypothetical protein